MHDIISINSFGNARYTNKSTHKGMSLYNKIFLSKNREKRKLKKKKINHIKKGKQRMWIIKGETEQDGKKWSDWNDEANLFLSFYPSSSFSHSLSYSSFFIPHFLRIPANPKTPLNFLSPFNLTQSLIPHYLFFPITLNLSLSHLFNPYSRFPNT